MKLHVSTEAFSKLNIIQVLYIAWEIYSMASNQEKKAIYRYNDE